MFTLSLLLDNDILILNKLTICSRDTKQWRMKLISTEGKLLGLQLGELDMYIVIF